MSQQKTLKIAFIGPKGCGKTKLANHVARTVLPDDTPYEATIGVRILPFVHGLQERGHSSFNRRSDPITVELWDCSGDQQFENCWAAIVKDLDGIVVVYDPNNRNAATELKLWCSWFCQKARLRQEQMACFAYTNNLDAEREQLVVKDEHDKNVAVPVFNVNLHRIDMKGGRNNGGDDEDDDMSGSSAASNSFDIFLTKCADFVAKNRA